MHHYVLAGDLVPAVAQVLIQVTGQVDFEFETILVAG